MVTCMEHELFLTEAVTYKIRARGALGAGRSSTEMKASFVKPPKLKQYDTVHR